MDIAQVRQYFCQTTHSWAQWCALSADGLFAPQGEKKIDERMEQQNICVVSSRDPRWCGVWANGKEFFLSCVGNQQISFSSVLGIVGPRKTTEYAIGGVLELLHIAQTYSLTTISGLADGIDSICASGSIKYHIPTVAVLGGGLYWGRNHQIVGPKMRAIIAGGGLIVSAYPCAFSPTPYTFPQRNEIIVRLSQVIFVPHAAIGSGSMLSVSYALTQKIPVRCLPFPYTDSGSAGTMQLVHDGTIRCCYDIEKFLGSYFSSSGGGNKQQQKITIDPNDTVAAGIIAYIQAHKTIPIAEIAALASCSIVVVMPIISIYEMDGWLVQDSPGIYRLA